MGQGRGVLSEGAWLWTLAGVTLRMFFFSLLQFPVRKELGILIILISENSYAQNELLHLTEGR